MHHICICTNALSASFYRENVSEEVEVRGRPLSPSASVTQAESRLRPSACFIHLLSAVLDTREVFSTRAYEYEIILAQRFKYQSQA